MNMTKAELKQHLHTHPHHKDWRHQVMAVIIGIFAFLAICAVALIFYGIFTKDKISLGVKVAGISVGGLPYSEALSKVSNAKNPMLAQTINISAGDQIYSTTPAELGTTLDIKSSIDKAYSIGKQENLWQRAVSLTEGLFTNPNYEISLTSDETKIETFLTDITSKTNKEPVNATLTVNSGNIVEVPGVNGVGLNAKKLKAELLNSINNLDSSNSITIAAKTEVLTPEIQAEHLEPAKIQAQLLTNHSFNLSFENQVYNIDQKVIASWLVFPVTNNAVTAVVSDELLKKYVDSLAKKIDIKAVDKTISDADQSVLNEGSDGRALNRTTLMSQIKSSLSTQDSGTITLALQVDQVARTQKIVRQPFTPGLYPGKYIEVNISNQRMYLWEGTNRIAEHIVSTGNIWSTPTPIGTRYIENKIPNAWSNTFKLYMPYWMSVGGGYGIHELPYWPDGRREGESALGRAVSHGCIRLGIGPAQEVYNFAEVGIPVYIHKN